jgi:hypothetical protein
MKRTLWDRNNPLFFYGNEEKLDSLLVRAFGEVVTQLSMADKSSVGLSMKLAAKFGGFLAALGVGEASAEWAPQVGSEATRTKIASVTFDSKLNALLEFCTANKPFPYIDLVRGLRLVRSNGAVVPDWKGTAIAPEDVDGMLGQVLGLFSCARLEPPQDATTSIVREFMDRTNNLWLFRTLNGSAIAAEIPVILSHVKGGSQHAVLALRESQEKDFKIEALGLLTWRRDTLMCDPVAWRLFY